VIALDVDSGHTLVRHARPQVLVKGGNWREQCVPEAALVRELGGLGKRAADAVAGFDQFAPAAHRRTRVAGADGAPLPGQARSGVGT
jgi:hypothetical protein